MSTTTNTAKQNSIFTGKRNSLVLAATNPKVHNIFEGKTLNEVGFEYSLNAEDVTLGSSTTPDGDTIVNLVLKINGTKYAVPFSKNYQRDKMSDPQWFMECEFRVNQKPVYQRVGGKLVKDEDGNFIKTGEMIAYLSFGNPSGIVFEAEVAAFSEEAVNELGNN